MGQGEEWGEDAFMGLGRDMRQVKLGDAGG